MPPKKAEREWFKSNLSLVWVLIFLVIVVLILSIFALLSPVSQNGSAGTSLPATIIDQDESTPRGELQKTQTADAEPPPPTPEEIGYTDGIIFMGTLLIMILLVSTLRETLRRKEY